MKKILIFIILILSLSLLGFTQTNKTRQQWEIYFKENLSSLDQIEGLWSVTTTPTITDITTGKKFGGDQTATNTFAVVKGKTGFDATPIDNSFPWLSIFEKSASPNIYFYIETIKETRSSINANVLLSDAGVMEFSFYYSEDYKQKLFPNSPPSFNRAVKMHMQQQWIKIFPAQSDIEKSIPTSGTGFAISNEGIIVTNKHVVENSMTIVVKGINGDFNRPFNAKILVSDDKNDIVLLKIDDASFTGLKNIPFTIKRELSNVGDEIFVLGYPMRATMGDEIKLTNGIISSKTGFQGDVTTYQISAPAQPGNSGGPLFNKNGELIGIVNAKHLGAENVTYAIKSNYLYNLIELLDSSPQLASDNSLINLNLIEQVKFIKEFIYIVEAK